MSESANSALNSGTMSRNSRERIIIIGLCLLLIAGILAVYAQTAGFEFVSYDDPFYVTGNPQVPEGLTLGGIKWAFTTRHTGNWIPLVWLSLMFDRTIFGFWAGGFHLVNVAFHIANTILLFWVLKRYTKAVWASFFVAALFALHPLHVESVAWVTERKDVLSTMFWLLTMLAYLRYVEIPSARRYVIVCVVFALGLMSKSMLVTLPFVLLLMDYWPLKRIWPEEKSNGVTIGRLILEKAPLFILSATSCMITFIAQKTVGAMNMLGVIPGGNRIDNALVSYCDYIFKMFLPVGLANIYPHPVNEIPGLKVAVSLAVLVVISIVVIFLRRRRYLLVGWLWYLGTLVPVVGFVQVGLQARADRYTYIPLTGIFIMLVWLAGDILAQRRLGRTLAGVGGAVILVVLGVVTFVQVGYWRNSMTLFTHAAAVTANNTVAYNALGVYYYGKGDYESAMRELEIVLNIDANNAAARNVLGVCYAGKGDYESAMREFETVLRIDANDATAIYNVARWKAINGETDEAIKGYKRVLAIVPGNTDAYISLAMIESNRGNFERAMDLYRDALKYHHENGDLHSQLGSLLLQTGRVDEAVKELETAVKLKENSAIYGKLGMVMLTKGDADKAARYFNRAIKLDPANAEVHYNLGNAFLAQNMLAKAVSEYEMAVKVNPNYAKAYGNLGLAFAQMGQIDKAIVGFRRVVELDPNNVEARFNLALALPEKGLIDEAIEHLYKVVKLLPQNTRAHCRLAEMLLLQGKIEQATAEYEQVLKIDPADEDAKASLVKIKTGNTTSGATLVK
ncbi:MAG: tetratricopeptide repeat protein [Sedimentisphaerales bacterium]|jgi:tetratricopeptide (TPR) repeat protein